MKRAIFLLLPILGVIFAMGQSGTANTRQPRTKVSDLIYPQGYPFADSAYKGNAYSIPASYFHQAFCLEFRDTGFHLQQFTVTYSFQNEDSLYSFSSQQLCVKPGETAGTELLGKLQSGDLLTIDGIFVWRKKQRHKLPSIVVYIK